MTDLASHADPPIVYHNNGQGFQRSRNMGWVYFGVLKRKLLEDRSIAGAFSKPSDLDVVLCHNYRSKPITQQVLENLGIVEISILGQGIRRWSNYQKIPLLLDHLKNYSNAKYVIHLDAADVILCDNPGEILSRFLADFDCDILFNGEKHSSPGSHMTSIPLPATQHVPGRWSNPANFVEWTEADLNKLRRIEKFETSTYVTPFRHLNSGCFIGRREAIIELLEQAEKIKGFIKTGHFAEDDQALIREIHRRWYPRIQLDQHCRIFQCMFYIEREQFQSKYPVNEKDFRLVYLKGRLQDAFGHTMRITRDQLEFLGERLGFLGRKRGHKLSSL